MTGLTVIRSETTPHQGSQLKHSVIYVASSRCGVITKTFRGIVSDLVEFNCLKAGDVAGGWLWLLIGWETPTRRVIWLANPAVCPWQEIRMAVVTVKENSKKVLKMQINSGWFRHDLLEGKDSGDKRRRPGL